MADPQPPVDSRQPDLEDSTNVAESHGTVVRQLAAAKREKRLREDGREPLSLWIVLCSAAVLLLAGGVLGAGGGLFDYDAYRVAGYVRKPAPGGEDSGPLTGPMLPAFMRQGAKVYSKCNGCHQSNGMGDGANYPPLGGSEWVLGETEAIAMIILNGLKGPIEVKGKTWDGNMAPMGPMTPAELATVMTYIRNSFGNDAGDVVTTEMAEAAIEISKKRSGGAQVGAQLTAEELKANHDRMLPGETVDPNTTVDLITLEPVEGAAPEADEEK